MGRVSKDLLGRENEWGASGVSYSRPGRDVMSRALKGIPQSVIMVSCVVVCGNCDRLITISNVLFIILFL